jgi:mycofactocin glycosyltransferase
LGSTARLASGFTAVPGGAAEAIRLAGRGHVLAGLSIARAAGRVWWPITLGLAATGPRARAAVLAALIVPHAIEWIRGPRPVGPVPALALGVADDIAYGFGVWEGMVKLGSFAAIRPDLVIGSDRGDTRTGG